MAKEFKGKDRLYYRRPSGIGLATAKQLAALGANVLVFARNRERLEAAVAAIQGSRISEEQWVASRQVDVGDNEDVRQVMAEAVERFGPPDLLINCAGKAYPHYFEEIDYEHFDDTMNQPLRVWNTTSALVPAMKRKGGTIVNVSSIAGFIGVFGYTAYCASNLELSVFRRAQRRGPRD